MWPTDAVTILKLNVSLMILAGGSIHKGFMYAIGFEYELLSSNLIQFEKKTVILAAYTSSSRAKDEKSITFFLSWKETAYYPPGSTQTRCRPSV